MHAKQLSISVFRAGADFVCLILLIGLSRVEALINEKGVTMTCYVNRSVNMRASFI